ncbi:hypothetical protein PIB30_051310 [Stylosanthes scabra]|uniref:Uncharacterized protein n=1 Tax=Stylosanthes scabra TaxID=79078 RepID=A0ABU6QHL4_9FABA|nr:hypothetical protein [Stylosanthes scabra]
MVLCEYCTLEDFVNLFIQFRTKFFFHIIVIFNLCCYCHNVIRCCRECDMVLQDYLSSEEGTSLKNSARKWPSIPSKETGMVRQKFPSFIAAKEKRGLASRS